MNRLSVVLTTLLLGLLLVGPAVAGDTVYYYSSDTLHSEVVITDANRNVVERTYYAPYGQVLNRALRDGPGYAGHEEDPESSLVYMQQRYFDPDSGRFLGSDPVATTDDGGSFNRYSYANDNPYRYTDPDGRKSVGEILDDDTMEAAERGNWFETYMLAFAGTAWTYLGAEPVSQVADKGSAASASDKLMAGVAVFTLGKGEEAATIGKDVAKAVEEAAEAARGGTYVLRDAKGNVMRTGRTNNLLRREAEHARDPALKDYTFEVAHRTDIYEEQRGLEQLLHGTYNPPLNKIRPVSPNNPNIQTYLDAAKDFLDRNP